MVAALHTSFYRVNPALARCVEHQPRENPVALDARWFLRVIVRIENRIENIREVQMKKLILGLCFLVGVSPLAMAQSKAKGPDMKAAPPAAKARKEPSAKQKAQQERMKSCSKQATGRKGDERKKFMSGCLKG